MRELRRKGSLVEDVSEEDENDNGKTGKGDTTSSSLTTAHAQEMTNGN